MCFCNISFYEKKTLEFLKLQSLFCSLYFASRYALIFSTNKSLSIPCTIAASSRVSPCADAVSYTHLIQRCRCRHACIGCGGQCGQANHEVGLFRLCDRNTCSVSDSRKCDVTVIYRLVCPDTSDVLGLSLIHIFSYQNHASLKLK